jgi:hypothetical protein
MLSIHHGWGWQPLQTASLIHIRNVKSVWVHWYAVHRHMVAAWHSHTHTTWLRFWGSGSLMESKWCHYAMVEVIVSQTASLIPMRYIQSVWAHWYAVHGHKVAALPSFTHANYLQFWGSGSLLQSQNDVITSWLRLTATSNCFPHPYYTCIKFWS